MFYGCLMKRLRVCVDLKIQNTLKKGVTFQLMHQDIIASQPEVHFKVTIY